VTDVVTGETRTIPIVFVNVADPITSGFAASLARPGGNVTGFANNNSALGGKWVQLLKELAPHTTHLALLFNTATGAPLQLFMPSIQAAASSLNVQVNAAPVLTRDEIESVIAGQARDPGGGVVVMPSAFSVANRDLIIALTARYGVPAIYFNRLFAESGGLIVYAADFIEQFRVAAEYVARILRGANPGELPVQNPTKYELLINLKTAKALGLDVPLNLQQIADEVIE
jgi:putative ABC transport system substrate-binding protein